MNSEKEIYLNTKIYLVALLCFMLSGISGYYLYKDMFLGGSEGLGEVYATVEKKLAKVKRKHAKSFSWNTIQSDEKLYKKDSVQTGDNSAATIKLKDGTVLELSENSLVVIDDIQNLTLNPIRGSLVLKTQSGDAQIKVGKDGKVLLEEFPIKLLTPEPLATQFTIQNTVRKINFTWQVVDSSKISNQNDSFIIEISSDKSFTQLVASQNLQDLLKGKHQLELKSGKYFWRIKNREKPISSVSQFEVVSSFALTLVYPKANEKVEIWEEDPSIQFKWTLPQDRDISELNDNPQVEHRIEVARDASFKNILISQKIDPVSTLVKLNNLPLNTNLFWRIESKFSDVTTYSKVESFYTEKAKLLAVELLNPKDQTTIEKNSMLKFSWYLNAQNLSSIEYEIEIQDKTESNKEKLQSKISSITWKPVRPDSYKWRVLAKIKDKVIGESKYSHFTVFEGAPLVLLTPKPNEKIYWWEKQIDYKFSWKEDEVLNQNSNYYYQVEVAKDETFSQIIASSKPIRETSVLASSFNLSQIYDGFWRVKIFDSDGIAIKSSKPEKFSYGLHPLLDPPNLIAPVSSYKKNIMKDYTPIKFSWSKVQDAVSYVFYIFDSKTNQQEVLRKLASENNEKKQDVKFYKKIEDAYIEVSPEILAKLSEGQFYWTVGAIDKLNRLGNLSTPQNFTIEAGEVLAPPAKIISPEVQ
jgi:hypothetical protein